MRWSLSFPIAKIFGIRIQIHYTFLLLLIGLNLWGFFSHGSAAAMVFTTIFILLIFLCVLLHELGHALAARYYKIRTTDITLSFIGGIAQIERLPKNPWQEFVIAIAGPAVNVAIIMMLCIGFGSQFLWRPHITDLFLKQPTAGNLLALIALELVRINFILFAFNLIPAFPMDGGRVLRSLLATKLGYFRATQAAAKIGQACAIAFFLVGMGALSFLGIPGNMFLIFIAFFVFTSAGQEAAVSRLSELLGSVKLSDLTHTQFQTLPSKVSLATAQEEYFSAHPSAAGLPVVNDQNQIVGYLTHKQLITSLRSPQGSEEPVSKVMRQDIPVISLTSSVDAAVALVRKRRLPALLVVDSDKNLAGIIDAESLTQNGMIRIALNKNPI